MHELAQKILSEMEAIGTADKATRQAKFFKEPVNLLGLMSADVRQIVRNHKRDVKHLRREQIFELCEELMKSGYWDTITAALSFVYDIRRKFQKQDFEIFSGWMDKYMSNWANCDEFCNRTVCAIIEMYPELTNDIKKWATSSNRWLRRGAVVSFIMPARRGKFLDTVFDITDFLIKDDDDMVRKGYSWALKEAGKSAPEQVFAYLASRRDIMPRIPFRTALEHFPPELRAKAMSL